MYCRTLCSLIAFSLLRLVAAVPAPSPPQTVLQSQAEANDSLSPLTENFNHLVNRAMEHFHVPGLSIAVMNGGRTFAKGYGFARLPDVRATPETLYYTGSTTKSFTAAAFSLLIDDSFGTEQELSWDTPVSSVIRDDFVLADSYVTEHATFEDIASHRTGLPRHDFSYGGNKSTLKDVVRSLRHLPLTAEFRTTFQYCNIMYMVLSYVIETITGQHLGKFMWRRIWNPLEMYNTYFSPEDALFYAGDNSLAKGYRWDEETSQYLTEPWDDEPVVSGAGNIISSVIDYTHYLRAMLHRAPPMSPSWYHEMRFPRTVLGADSHLTTGPSLYTLGWEYINYRGHEVYTHSGSVTGFGTIMAFIPSKNWAAAIFSNTETTGNYVTNGLMLHVMDDILGTPPRDRFDWITAFDGAMEEEAKLLKHARDLLYPLAPRNPIHHSRLLKDYCGTYYHPGYRTLTLELMPPSSRLPLRFNQPQVLYALQEHSDITAFYFEHVSGEHFVAWMVENDRDNGTADDAVRAKFEVSAHGVPAKLGIELEPEMNGEKIWFERVSS